MTFEFMVRPDEPFTLESAVYQALGAASVCWEHVEGAGTFQPEQAKEIAERLIAYIEQEWANQ